MGLAILAIMVIALGGVLRLMAPGMGAKSGSARLLSYVVMLFGVGLGLLNAVILIDVGEVGVKHFLGRVSSTPLEQGVHIINPLASVEKMSIREQAFPVDGSVERIEAQTSEQLNVTLEVSMLYRIDGAKDRVEAGEQAGVLLVTATCDGELRQFLVPADAAGVTVTSQGSVDMVKRYARIEFAGVEVGEDAAVGAAGQTAAIVERQRQIALVLQCAELVGILDSVLGFTTQWLNDRHSFGRPLASYQALKHRAADMKMWAEACRGTTAAAVRAVADRSADAKLLASVAKAYVAERVPVILQDCVQLHGGIGVTWEHDLHVYLRRVILYRAMFGSPEDHHRAVYALSRKSQR